MELLRDSIPMVSLAVFVAALYSRAASSHLRPGVPRLAALLPVVAFLAAVPLAFAYSAILRGVAAFFFTWLTALKVALLSAGRGPLDPDLPVLPFVFTATLPIKLARRPGPGAGETAMSPSPNRRRPSFRAQSIIRVRLPDPTGTSMRMIFYLWVTPVFDPN
jgi:hypothetical protein